MAPKKGFKKNPAEIFISDTQSEKNTYKGDPVDGEPQRRLKYVPVEKKDRRVQLLLQQSLYDAVKGEADEAGISLNEYINQILQTEIYGKNNI